MSESVLVNACLGALRLKFRKLLVLYISFRGLHLGANTSGEKVVRTLANKTHFRLPVVFT